MITCEEALAARQLLGWSRVRLAAKAGTCEATLRNFEVGKGKSRVLNILNLQNVLEAAGVEFANDGHLVVRFRKDRNA